MRTAICAIAKNENTYINEWVNYHLNLDFDKIYLYDNNDIGTPFVGDFIERKSDVEIKRWKIDNRFSDQVTAYNDFITNYGQQYDWCAFIDLDEFICLNFKSVKEFLSEAPLGYNILLNWHVFGDDGCIVGDETKPVRERFTEEKVTIDFSIYKALVNFRVSPNYKAFSPHCFSTDDLLEDAPCVDSNFNSLRCDSGGRISGSYNDIRKNRCYIAHYQTKSLSEYLKYKYDARWNYCTLDYYFKINDRTPEKEAYIRKYFEQYEKG